VKISSAIAKGGSHEENLIRRAPDFRDPEQALVRCTGRGLLPQSLRQRAVSVHVRPLLTDSVQVRSQRIGSELIFPDAGRERFDFAGRMLVDPLQHIDQVGVRIDAVQPAGGQQALDDADVPGAGLGPAESSQPRGLSPLGCSQNRT